MQPQVYILNIRPVNWDECDKAKIFGTRHASRSGLERGNLVLVRRTGKDYGCLRIWEFENEVKAADVPWTDADYTWKQSFKELASFTSPFSEEFAGTSKYSVKVALSAMRLAGSIVHLKAEELSRYLAALLREKSSEMKPELKNVLQALVTSGEKAATAVQVPRPPPRKGDIVGEPLNYRGIIYAPLNEAGVILLFSRMMEDLGIIYESSPAEYPDMIGRIRTVRGYERVRIEFEFVSNNFFRHGHDPSGCDMIVCWENDLKSDKADELEHNGVKILALSEIIEGGTENQLHDEPGDYSASS
jgi:hypothetical protein